jgi:hypothetical protein
MKRGRSGPSTFVIMQRRDQTSPFQIDRPFVGDEGSAGADSFNDDGCVVPVELFRQLLFRVTRYILGANAKRAVSSER